MRAIVAVTGKPVQLPDDNTIKGMLIAVLYHSLKFGAVVGLCRERAVYVVADNLNIVIGLRCYEEKSLLVV